MDFKNLAYDIIILAGQSNGQGTGRGPVTDEYIPSEDIISLTAEYTISRIIDNDISKRLVIYPDKPFILSIAEERIVNEMKIGDLSLSFAREYKRAGLIDAGRKILIIRAAIGATGFMHGHWGVHAPLYRKLIELTDYALSLNTENRIKAFLWHQGEHEVGKMNPPANYAKQLDALFSDYKARYSIPTLPIISGDFTKEWKISSLRRGRDPEPICQTIKSVTESHGGRYVKTEDLLTNNQMNADGDITHFCREALDLLGKRYFKAYNEIIK